MNKEHKSVRLADCKSWCTVLAHQRLALPDPKHCTLRGARLPGCREQLCTFFALSLWRSLIGQLSATLASDWLGLVCVESQAIDRSRFIAAFKCLERDIMIKWQNIKGLVNVWKYRTETEIRYGKTEILFYPLVFVRIVFIPQKITLLDQSGPFLLRVFVTILY